MKGLPAAEKAESGLTLSTEVRRPYNCSILFYTRKAFKINIRLRTREKEKFSFRVQCLLARSAAVLKLAQTIDSHLVYRAPRVKMPLCQQ